MGRFSDNVIEYRLDNGLHVVLKPTPTDIVTAALNVYQGAKDQESHQVGLAHFLEHTLTMAGTRSYDPEEQRRLERTTNYWNAGTSVEVTQFEGEMLPSKLGTWFSLAAEGAFMPRFDSEYVERERRRICEEIAEKSINRELGFWTNQAFEEILVGKDSPYTTTLGDTKVIQAATIDDLRTLHRKGFHPNNAKLILVGALPDDIETRILKNFGNIPHGTVNVRDFDAPQPLTENYVQAISAPYLCNPSDPEQSRATIYLGLIGPYEFDRENAAAGLLGTIVHKRLLHEVGMEKQMLYTSYCKYWGAEKRGIYQIYANVNARRIREGLDAIFGIMAELQRTPISVEECEDMKDDYLFWYARHMQENKMIQQILEATTATGRTYEQEVADIRSLTPADIQNVAQRRLTDGHNSHFALVVHDPFLKGK